LEFGAFEKMKGIFSIAPVESLKKLPDADAEPTHPMCCHWLALFRLGTGRGLNPAYAYGAA